MRYQCTTCGAHGARSDLCQVCLEGTLQRIEEIPPPEKRHAAYATTRFARRHALAAVGPHTRSFSGWRP